jgi:hypothetical protein
LLGLLPLLPLLPLTAAELPLLLLPSELTVLTPCPNTSMTVGAAAPCLLPVLLLLLSCCGCCCMSQGSKCGRRPRW